MAKTFPHIKKIASNLRIFLRQKAASPIVSRGSLLDGPAILPLPFRSIFLFLRRPLRRSPLVSRGSRLAGLTILIFTFRSFWCKRDATLLGSLYT